MLGIYISLEIVAKFRIFTSKDIVEVRMMFQG